VGFLSYLSTPVEFLNSVLQGMSGGASLDLCLVIPDVGMITCFISGFSAIPIIDLFSSYNEIKAGVLLSHHIKS